MHMGAEGLIFTDEDQKCFREPQLQTPYCSFSLYLNHSVMLLPCPQFWVGLRWYMNWTDSSEWRGKQQSTSQYLSLQNIWQPAKEVILNVRNTWPHFESLLMWIVDVHNMYAWARVTGSDYRLYHEFKSEPFLLLLLFYSKLLYQPAYTTTKMPHFILLSLKFLVANAKPEISCTLISQDVNNKLLKNIPLPNILYQGGTWIETLLSKCLYKVQTSPKALSNTPSYTLNTLYCYLTYGVEFEPIGFSCKKTPNRVAWPNQGWVGQKSC